MNDWTIVVVDRSAGVHYTLEARPGRPTTCEGDLTGPEAAAHIQDLSDSLSDDGQVAA